MPVTQLIVGHSSSGATAETFISGIRFWAGKRTSLFSFLNQQSDTPTTSRCLRTVAGSCRKGQPQTILRFTHALIRDAVNQTLMRMIAGRCTLKWQISFANIEASDSLRDPCAHLYRATRFGESIQIRLAASADTLARGACGEAEGHCESALKIGQYHGRERRRAALQTSCSSGSR